MLSQSLVFFFCYLLLRINLVPYSCLQKKKCFNDDCCCGCCCCLQHRKSWCATFIILLLKQFLTKLPLLVTSYRSDDHLVGSQGLGGEELVQVTLVQIADSTGIRIMVNGGHHECCPWSWFFVVVKSVVDLTKALTIYFFGDVGKSFYVEFS